MQAVFLFAGPDIGDQLVEGIIVAVVGGDHLHPAAPDEHGQGRLEQSRQVVVKGRLVDDDLALFAPQVGGAGGQGHDLKARGELDPEGHDVLAVPAFVFKHHFLHGRRRLVILPGPVGAIIDVFLGHFLVVADVKDVHAILAAAVRTLSAASPQEAPMRRDFSQTFTVALIGHPMLLIWQKDVAGVLISTPKICRRI